MGLTPDSRRDWIGLIESYDAAGPRERREIVSRFKRDGAFHRGGKVQINWWFLDDCNFGHWGIPFIKLGEG